MTPPPTCHVYRFGRKSKTICSSPQPQWEYSSSWVGIGGYCEDTACDKVDNTLIQLGTEHDASVINTTEYYAWIEMLPNAPIVISMTDPNCNSLSCAAPVQPGDVITASLKCTSSNCTTPDGKPQTWSLEMTDQNPPNSTPIWTFTKKVTYNSTLLSAEFVQEAPSSSGGVLPLANYGTANFDPTVNGGAAPNFDGNQTASLNANAIQLVDPYGETSTPSGPDLLSPTVDAFDTCWGNDPNNIATCPGPH
jgi:hypothetical protein